MIKKLLQAIILTFLAIITTACVSPTATPEPPTPTSVPLYYNVPCPEAMMAWGITVRPSVNEFFDTIRAIERPVRQSYLLPLIDTIKVTASAFVSKPVPECGQHVKSLISDALYEYIAGLQALYDSAPESEILQHITVSNNGLAEAGVEFNKLTGLELWQAQDE